MAYTLDNLRTDIRRYTEVVVNCFNDSVLNTIIKMQKIIFTDK